jgi:uncharacterized protein YkwD
MEVREKNRLLSGKGVGIGLQLLKAGRFQPLIIFGLAGLLIVCLVVFTVKPAQAASGHNYWVRGTTGFDRPGIGEDECPAAEELAMLRLINRERTQRGLPKLEWDPQLTALARAKSRDMVCYNYFGHISARLGSVYDQLQQEGLVYRIVGENLVGAPGYRRAQQSLMKSPAHRGNILNCNFTRIGIGMAVGGAYRKIYTQIYKD